jgi:hypothetical protein
VTISKDTSLTSVYWNITTKAELHRFLISKPPGNLDMYGVTVGDDGKDTIVRGFWGQKLWSPQKNPDKTNH